jgi:hypothetical protein
MERGKGGGGAKKLINASCAPTVCAFERSRVLHDCSYGDDSLIPHCPVASL